MIGGIIVFYILLAVTPLLGLLALLVLLALLPWIVIRSWRYNAIMSSYRGVRFNYVCRTGRAYWALLFCPLLLIIGLYVALIILLSIGSGFGSINAISLMVVLTLMLAVPAFAAVNGIISALQHDLYVNNLFFGRTPFIAELKKSAFIKFALIGLLIFLPFMLAALVCMGSFILSLYQMVLMGMLTDETADLLVLENIGSLLLMMVILLIGALISGSYQIVAQRNYLFNRDAERQHQTALFHANAAVYGTADHQYPDHAVLVRFRRTGGGSASRPLSGGVYVGRRRSGVAGYRGASGNRQQRGGRRSGAGAGSGRQFLRRQ